MKKILFLATLALLASCQKNDDDTSQDEDRKEQNKALQNELTSNKDGWKLTYIAEDGSTGGYQFLMKFGDDGTVTMTSDISSTTTPTATSYSTQEKNGALVLSFIGQNYLHQLADAIKGNAANGLSGKVYQFQYVGKEGNNLKFLNLLKSSKPTLVFEPATANDWSNIDTFVANLNPITKLTDYYYLKVTTATQSVTYYNVSFDSRVLALKDTNIKAPVAATQEGIAFLSPLTIEGKSFTSLTRSGGTVTPTYSATVDGVTASLFFSSISPEFLNSNDYRDINTSIEGFSIMTQHFKNNKFMSKTFYEDVLKVNNSTDLFMLKINFVDAGECEIQIGHIFAGSGFSIIQVNCEYELKNNRLYLKNLDSRLRSSNATAWNDAKNAAVLEKAKRALGAIYSLGVQGYYIKKKDIVIEPLTDNPVYYLQSHEYPLYTFPAWGVPL